MMLNRHHNWQTLRGWLCARNHGVAGVLSARSKRGFLVGSRKLFHIFFIFWVKRFPIFYKRFFSPNISLTKYFTSKQIVVAKHHRLVILNISKTTSIFKIIKPITRNHFITKLLCESNPLNCQTWSRTNNHNLGENGILLSTFKI